MKSCVDCKHCVKISGLETLWECHSPNVLNPIWMEGSKTRVYPWVDQVRVRSNMCGRDGEWWESKYE